MKVKMINYFSKISDDKKGLNNKELHGFIEELIGNFKNLKKILLIPPDMTRMHSKAGEITAIFYNLLKNDAVVHILPALGTHDPMDINECSKFFGTDIPFESVITHNWRSDVINLGEIPGKLVETVSEGKLNFPIKVDINKLVLDSSYDLIVSIGQVVPHEVIGMANYSKNILVGCGGEEIINKSHFLGAVYGMERVMGRDFSPVRKIFDYAQEKFLNTLPLLYVLTVTTSLKGNVALNGIFAGKMRNAFEDAVELSSDKNITYLKNKVDKVIVYLDPEEFKSTWLGNKAVYRTRMIIKDGGELVIIAPGVKKFGEDVEIDKLIRKFGYSDSQQILRETAENENLQRNLSAAAHLIHGSSEGRFKITYAPGHLTKEEIEGVGYNFLDIKEAIEKYNPFEMKEGFNTAKSGEKIYFVSKPASGLWKIKEK